MDDRLETNDDPSPAATDEGSDKVGLRNSISDERDNTNHRDRKGDIGNWDGPTIHSFPKSRNTVIVRLRRLLGKTFLDIREDFTGNSARQTKKGISMRLDEMPDVGQALVTYISE